MRVCDCGTRELTFPHSLSPACVSLDEAFKRAIDAGAEVAMPLADMSWGDRYGKVTDPFGHKWSIATHVEDVPPDQLPARAAAPFLGGLGRRTAPSCVQP